MILKWELQRIKDDQEQTTTTAEVRSLVYNDWTVEYVTTFIYEVKKRSIETVLLLYFLMYEYATNSIELKLKSLFPLFDSFKRA